MDINFLHPFYLLLFIPAIAIVVWWLKTQKRVKGSKRYLIAITRLLILTLLILALTGIELLFPISGETVVFVLDKSASMKNNTEAVEYIQEAIDNKQENDKYAIISVGTKAVVEQPMSNNNQISIGANINPNGTNIADGIRLANGMIPNNSNGRIVLVSDGLDTYGNLYNEVNLAKEQGNIIDGYLITNNVEEEVLISSIDVPNKLYLNEEFEGYINIESNITTTGLLRIYEGNSEISTKEINIEKGDNAFIFQSKASEEGFHKFRAELIAANDTLNVNNQAFAYTEVQGKPRILIVEGHAGAGGNLVNALRSNKTNIDVISTQQLPNQLEEYKQYTSIILSDVQATQITNKDMSSINTAVRDMGIGLIMTGGYDSFGLGGWFQTPIEEALPVYMDLRGKKELPSLGLMLVIDKSGSMSGDPYGGFSKIELAKEAALRSIDMLHKQDYIGVVAFDSQPWVVIEPESAENIKEIEEKISGIYADGGTDIYPALLEGYNQIKKLDTQRKHIILLTDGQSATNNSYEQLLNEAKENNITVSTVAIGEGADTQLLEYIANLGNGRFYFSNDSSSIPKIFSKETALASRAYVVDKPQIPIKLSTYQWTTLEDNLPIIDAYIATTPKQTAETYLTSSDNDPILTRWKYGLGRSVAWTSDIEGKWSKDWVIWDNFVKLWNQIVEWTYPNVSDNNWQVETNVEGINGTITVTIPSNNLPQGMSATIINSDIESEIINLKPIAPNKLQGNFKVDKNGTYIIQITEMENNNIIASQTEGLNISYSPEYRNLNNNNNILAEIVELGSGQIITDPKELFNNSSKNSWEKKNIDIYFIILATVLWPFDIFIRRINISNTFLYNIKNKFYKRKKVSEKESTFSTLVNLRKSKEPIINETNNIEYILKEEKNYKLSVNKEKNIKRENKTENDTFKKLLESKKKKN